MVKEKSVIFSSLHKKEEEDLGAGGIGKAEPSCSVGIRKSVRHIPTRLSLGLTCTHTFHVGQTK
jgi:hypothetical protein